jgi:hypothetical protein
MMKKGVFHFLELPDWLQGQRVFVLPIETCMGKKWFYNLLDLMQGLFSMNLIIWTGFFLLTKSIKKSKMLFLQHLLFSVMM